MSKVVGLGARSRAIWSCGLWSSLVLALALGACDEDTAGDGQGSADSGSPGTDAGPGRGDGAVDAPADAGGSAGADEDQRPEGVALCYSALSGNHAATATFWDSFRGGKLEDREAAIAALTAASEEHPDEEEFALLLGLAHLWRVAEPLPEQVDDMAGFVQSALGARTELERAYALCPTDHRIPAWLGPILVNTGRALMDEATEEEGLDVLQLGIDHYPAFVLFSKVLIFADRPKDDPDFQNALEALTENIDLCTPTDPACSNHPHAAHNFEGASVFMGDVLAKAGDRDEALDAYEMAKGAAEYPEWDYEALLDDRIETLDERIAAYDDDDPDNDPVAAWSADNQCSICHRQ